MCKQEPAGLIAQWLALHDWSWKAAALKLLPARKRTRVLELMHALTMREAAPTALDAALLQALYTCIISPQGRPENAITPARSPALRTAAPWWRRFTARR